jgi:hypothetical protein
MAIRRNSTATCRISVVSLLSKFIIHYIFRGLDSYPSLFFILSYEDSEGSVGKVKRLIQQPDLGRGRIGENNFQ